MGERVTVEANLSKMFYRILADIIVIVHFAWILFMLAGFILTLRGFFRRRFFDRWLFRTIHLFGILYVSLLAIMGKFCPLTIWEGTLRTKHDPDLMHSTSFIVYYIEKLVYPAVNPLIVLIPTIIIAIFTIVVFIVRPPARIKKMFR